MADLLHGRLFRLISAAALLFGAAALAMDAPHLILVSNALVCLVALAVVISYAPIVYASLAARVPTRGDFLGLGIFMSWLAQFCLRIVSIIARDFGHPEIVNTHWTSNVIDASLIGALLHLSAANAAEGRIPKKRWVRIGIMVASGVGLIFMLWTFRTQVVNHDFRPL